LVVESTVYQQHSSPKPSLSVTVGLISTLRIRIGLQVSGQLSSDHLAFPFHVKTGP
jgi:hypothetical protein